MTMPRYREELEIALSAAFLIATFYVAPAMGVELPPEATGVAILGASALFGDGAGDFLRKITKTTEIDDRLE